MPKYDKNEIHYCCLKLQDGGLLDIISFPVMNQTMHGIKLINDITYEGHQFLENIKSDNVWNKTKTIAKNVGSFSIQTLKDIAVNVISESIKNNF